MASNADYMDNSNTDLDIGNPLSTFGRLYSCILIWFCPSNILTTLPLERFKNIDTIQSVETFDKAFACIARLSELRNEKVILVLSNTFAENMISIVHDETNILYIYLFSNDTETELRWMQNYSKFHGLYSDIDTLISKIVLDTDKSAVRTDKTISLADEYYFIIVNGNTKSSSSTENPNETTKDFISFQIFIDVLLSSEGVINQYDSRRQAIVICREKYGDNPVALKNINEFESTYKRIDAVYWYIRPMLLSRMLDKAFLRFDFAVLFAFRSWILDLHTQLNILYHEQKEALQQFAILYAGKALSKNELVDLKNNIGGLILMKTFFETTKDVAVALMFCGDGQTSPGFESVLFKIQIESKINHARPFADIQSFSPFPDEKLVLFAAGSVFRTEELYFDAETHIWNVNLTCTNEVQAEVTKIIYPFTMDMNTPVDMITYGNVLNKLSRAKETEKYYEVLLKVCQPSNEDLATIFCNLGIAYQLQNEYQLALEYYKKALDKYSFTSGATDKLTNDTKTKPQRNQNTWVQGKVDDSLGSLSQIYNNIGSVHLSQHNYETAFEYLQKSLNVASGKHTQSVNLGEVYHNLGSVSSSMGDYANALKYYEQSLRTALETLPSDHPLIRQSLHNIGSLKQHTCEDAGVTSTTKHFQSLNTMTDEHDATSATTHPQTSITFNDKCDVPTS